MRYDSVNYTIQFYYCLKFHKEKPKSLRVFKMLHNNNRAENFSLGNKTDKLKYKVTITFSKTFVRESFSQ